MKPKTDNLQVVRFLVLWSFLQPSRALERFCLIGAFPGEFDIVAAKVTIRGSLSEDRFTQAKVTDDRAGAQVKVLSL